MTDADRELLTVLSQVGNCFGEVAVRLLEDSLTRDEQIAFGHELVNLAERFRQRALRTSGMIVEGIVIDDHDRAACGSDGCPIPSHHEQGAPAGPGKK